MVRSPDPFNLPAQGPNSTVTAACAAGAQAVGVGLRLIERGDADIVFAGGADSRIDPLLLLPLAVYHDVVVGGAGRWGAAETAAAMWIDRCAVYDPVKPNALPAALSCDFENFQ